MPSFSTPHPVAAVVDVGGVELTVHAGDHAETTVVVVPHNPDRAGDVALARRTTVDLVDSRLVVRSPSTARSRLRSLFGTGDRVDVDLELPTSSTLEVRGWGDVTAEGTLGAVEVDTGLGDVALDAVGGRLRVRTSMGDIRVGSTTGDADLRTSAGAIEIGRAAGEVTARTSAGDVRVDDGGGELRLSTSAGDVRVERAASTVSARTSAGDIRLHSVRTGTVTAESSYGRLEIGVARGSAAWLDVEARHGVVRSELEEAEGPDDAELSVEIRATAGYGDIVLRRA